jgi:hypothetical protein
MVGGDNVEFDHETRLGIAADDEPPIHQLKRMHRPRLKIQIDKSALHGSKTPQTRINNSFQAATMPSNPRRLISIMQRGRELECGEKSDSTRL